MTPVIPAARSSEISLWYCLAVQPMVVPLGWRKAVLITGAAAVAAPAEVAEVAVSVTGVSTAAAASVTMVGNFIGRTAVPVCSGRIAACFHRRPAR